MNLSYAAVALAFSFIYLSKLPVAVAQSQMGGYDNENPRDQQAKLTGWGRRALAAHYNTIESIPGFAAAVIVANLLEADPSLIEALCVVFIVSRLAFIGLYIKNRCTLRSGAWGVGFVATMALFLVGFLG